MNQPLRDPLLTQGQAPPREKLFAKANSMGVEQNMTAKRRQGSNLQFEAKNIEDEIVIRILSNCEPQKLDEIEKKNEEENVHLQTDELWKRLITKDFGASHLYKARDYKNYSRPYKELYNGLNRERMEREDRMQKIQQDSKRSKQSATIMVGAKTLAPQTKAIADKHMAKTIDPIRQPTRIRNSTKSRTSDRPKATSSTPLSSKKSKLWTSSLGESTSARKKPEPSKSSVFIPGNVASARNSNPPMRMNRYTPPISSSTPLVYRQPVVVSKGNIDYTKKRPSSPPTSDTIAGTPLISPSYVNNLFGQESSKRFEKVKRQSNNDSSKLRDSTRAPQRMQPLPTKSTEQRITPKSHSPVAHNSSSLAPPQKKVKLNDNPPPRSTAPPTVSSVRSNSDFNFTIPKRR